MRHKAKSKEYLDILLNDLCKQTGWNPSTVVGIFIDFIEGYNDTIKDDFLNYAEKIAEEERRDM